MANQNHRNPVSGWFCREVATTREIDRVAEVSEVTLFRHFQSKEQLLSAIAQHMTALR